MATSRKTSPRKAADATADAVQAVQSADATLQQIAEATQAGSFVYTAASVHGPLIEAGHVEINPAMSNDAGEIATRATEKGIKSMTSTDTPVQEQIFNEPAVAAAVATKPGAFAIEVGVPMPAISGRGRRSGNMYPFDTMEVGHSFFVPNTEDKPNAAKSLASTVSSATARYSVPSSDGATKTNKAGEQVPVMVETRKFVARSVTENGVAGARIWRAA